MTRPAAQLSLWLHGEPPPAPVRPKRPPKPHHRPRPDGELLPPSPRYLPVVGVPKTRAECPDTSKGACPHLRCRWHLHRVDSETRAGRPGLAHVPRDERGLTLAVEGDLGTERAQTTADARWLELERRCKVYVDTDETGTSMLALYAVYEAEADRFFAALHVGEPVDVLDGEVLDEEALSGIRPVLPRVMGAVLTPTESIKFEREPVGLVKSYVFTLQRVRGVSSCALDEIARKGKLSNEQTGDAIGRHRTLVARELKDALRKACETAEEMGMSQEDFVASLMSMGEQGK